MERVRVGCGCDMSVGRQPDPFERPSYKSQVVQTKVGDGVSGLLAFIDLSYRTSLSYTKS